MDIEARVEGIEKRLAALEARVARLERLLARHAAAISDTTTDARIRQEMTELKKLIGGEEELPPLSKRH